MKEVQLPRLVQRQCGGWLALAPRGASLRIGVWADSEDAARDKYRTTVEGWQATLAMGVRSSEDSASAKCYGAQA